jgi:hypothetical protein
MIMDNNYSKENYLPPKIYMVSFMVEKGYGGSGNGQSTQLPALEVMKTTSNSGDNFWGGNSEGSGQTIESFEPFQWQQ